MSYTFYKTSKTNFSDKTPCPPGRVLVRAEDRAQAAQAVLDGLHEPLDPVRRRGLLTSLLSGSHAPSIFQSGGPLQTH